MLLLTLYTQEGQRFEINVASSLMPSHVFEHIQRSSTAFKRRRQPPTAFIHGERDGIKNQAFIYFSSVQTDAIHCGRPRSMAVAHHHTPSTTFEHTGRSKNVALLDCSSVLIDAIDRGWRRWNVSKNAILKSSNARFFVETVPHVRMPLTTFETFAHVGENST